MEACTYTWRAQYNHLVHTAVNLSGAQQADVPKQNKDNMHICKRVWRLTTMNTQPGTNGSSRRKNCHRYYFLCFVRMPPQDHRTLKSQLRVRPNSLNSTCQDVWYVDRACDLFFGVCTAVLQTTTYVSWDVLLELGRSTIFQTKIINPMTVVANFLL